MQIAPDEDVEELVAAADLDIGADDDGVPALHDRILNLVQSYLMPLAEAILEILALHHLVQRDARVEADHVEEIHFLEPRAVVNDLGLRFVEHEKRLLGVGIRIRHDLLVSQRRARGRATTRITDHRGEVANDEHDVMSQLLKLLQLPQTDRMTEMNVRRSRIDAELDAERFAARELVREFLLAVDRDGAALEDFELFRDGKHGARSMAQGERHRKRCAGFSRWLEKGDPSFVSHHRFSLSLVSAERSR